MIGSEMHWSAVLSAHVAARRARTGERFEICERMRPVFAEMDNRWPQVGTISAAASAGTISDDGLSGTISARRGRPRKGAEAGTISAARPWDAEGISRRTWYRRQSTRTGEFADA